MTPAERKHLREAQRILRTIINHERGIDTDGSYRAAPSSGDYVVQTGNNWQRILAMIREWKLEEK